MGKIKNFRDLKVWQKAHQLVLQVYRITERFPQSEIYGLTNQIRRAVISVASNIVEGFERKSSKDSLHFYSLNNSEENKVLTKSGSYNMADGSLEELKYQLLVAFDLKYINDKIYKEILDLAEEVSKMLNSWIQSQIHRKGT